MMVSKDANAHTETKLGHALESVSKRTVFEIKCCPSDRKVRVCSTTSLAVGWPRH